MTAAQTLQPEGAAAPFNWLAGVGRRAAGVSDNGQFGLFAHELIIDNFAGGGGTSTGLEAAFGRPVDVAINHDPEALAMHALNHPYTLHLCESVWDVDPIEVTRNQPVGLVWLSPDCKHFSKAKGATPVAKHIRGLAWVGMRWVAKCKPRVLMLENVEEFQDWGPLMQVERQWVDDDGKEQTGMVWMPDPAKKGRTFKSFVRQLRAHGYEVDWREMRACDNGAPTIRKRLFLQARRDGIPIDWPEQTNGDPVSSAVVAGKLKPWRTAAECIDFSIKSKSIFKRDRALAINTQRRVAKGLWRHVMTTLKPYIVGAGGPSYAGEPVSTDQPLGTIPAENHRGVAQPVLAPVIVGVGGRAGQSPARPVDAPTGTTTSKADTGVATSVLAPFISEHANSSNQRTMAANEPLRTQCAEVKGGHFSLVAPELQPVDDRFLTAAAEQDGLLAPLVMTNTTGHPGAQVGSPLPTIATGGHHALVAASISPLRGTSEGHLGAADAAVEPLSTISASGTHHALVGAYMVNTRNGERPGQDPRVRGAEEPYWTVSAQGSQGALSMAHLAKFRGDSAGVPLDNPMPTVTGNSFVKRPGGAPPLGVVNADMVAAHLIDMGHGESCSTGAKRWSEGHRSVRQPLPTCTASSVSSAVTAVHLTHLTHHGDRPGRTPDEPLPAITGAHRGEQVLIAACMEQANGGFYDGHGRPADAPMSTITSAGSNQQLITAYCVKYYSSGGQDQSVAGPLHTLPTKGRMGLVEVAHVPADSLAPEHREGARACARLMHEHLPEHFPEVVEMLLVWQRGQWWVLVDVTLRMLKPPELYRAQGFPAKHIHHEIPDPKLLFVGGRQVPGDPRLLPRIPLTATAQVRMCGNSVSPYQSEALARNAFKHEALIGTPQRRRRAAQQVAA